MRQERGAILVIVLYVLVVLSVLALSLSYRAGVEVRAQRNDAIMSKLKAQVASAVAIALGRLAENTNDFDHFAESWHTHAPLASESWLPDWSPPPGDPPSEFTADYSVIDEEGKLHVLAASSEALQKLGLNTQQIASFFDWIDADSAAGAEGAENEYYLAQNRPYRSKNAPVEMLDELLLIRGFDHNLYVGEDENHNRLLDAGENDGGLSYPIDDADGRLRLGLVDLLTAVGDRRINLNTAPREVLLTLPISEQAVGQLIGYRSFDEASSGSLQEHVFRSVTDIEQLQGLTDPERQSLALIACFRSTHFRVFAWAKHVPTGLRYDAQVLVKMVGDKPQVLEWKVGR